MFAQFTKVLVAALALAAALGAFVADASARYVPVPSTTPARIIEVRPGLWVGSYQCITDLERGGRDCSSGS